MLALHNTAQVSSDNLPSYLQTIIIAHKSCCLSAEKGASKSLRETGGVTRCDARGSLTVLCQYHNNEMTAKYQMIKHEARFISSMPTRFASQRMLKAGQIVNCKSRAATQASVRSIDIGANNVSKPFR